MPQRASGVLRIGINWHDHENDTSAHNVSNCNHDPNQTMNTSIGAAQNMHVAVDILYCRDDMSPCKDKFEGRVM